MLAWLPVVYFFGLITVPGMAEAGLLAFALFGAWSLYRPGLHAALGAVSKTDLLMGCAMTSVFLFKLLTLLWTDSVSLTVRNAVWHLHFLLWPLVALALVRCQARLQNVEAGIALAMVLVAAWYLLWVSTGWPVLAFEDAGTTHPGVLAQESLVLGIWLLLAATRPETADLGAQRRLLLLVGALAAPVVLVASGRRLELLGYVLLAPAFAAYRYRAIMTRARWAGSVVLVLGIMAALLYLRWDKFALGFSELQSYFNMTGQDRAVIMSSWGARLEMYRVGIQGFLDHPWLGMSAGARPYLMEAYGVLGREDFGHRHFHSQLLQTLVEGGLLGLFVMLLVLGYTVRHLIVRAWHKHHEEALIALALYMGYAVEGAFSAALTYGEANAMFVALSAWLWCRVRVRD